MRHHLENTILATLAVLLSVFVTNVQAEDKDWTALFNGKDLKGWKHHPDQTGTWEVRDGVLTSRGPQSHLFSERGDFENFHLRAEAQINAKGDSGVIFRSEFGLNRLHLGKLDIFPKGYEAQILGSGTEKSQQTGSLIDFKTIHEQLIKPDTWFTLEVIAEGKHIIIKVDGKTTVDYQDEKNTYVKGHFALQQHDDGTVVKFRKIEVKVLTPKLSAINPPPFMELLKYQTPIRNQGSRDTCPYFPPVAALEAAYAREGVKVNLSVEHLVWLRNVTAGSDKAKYDVAENLFSTVGGGNGINVLQRYAISKAQDMPYHGDEPRAAMKTFGVDKYDWSKPFNQFLLNRWNLDPRLLTPQARTNAKYAIEKYETIAPQDLHNPKKYEEVLASGREIVFSINIQNNSDDSAKGEPVWRFKPGGKADTLNHFMLIVGYDRPRHFFIVKNQWGPTKYDPKKLAAGWKDVIKYNGYTLVDYNYLLTCSGAQYITAVAPLDSTRFVAQRALGQWQVTFIHEGKQTKSGILAWRRLPNSELGLKQPDLRIGDLVTQDGKQYRVNAKLEGDGKKPYLATVNIDFNTGTIPADSTDGIVWKGTLTLPETGDGSLELSPEAATKQAIWGVQATEVQISAKQVRNKNLLMSMEPPK